MTAREGDAPARDVDSLDSSALDLFMACLDQPEGDRRAWLEQRCGNDTDLLRRTLQMLAADTASEQFLSREIGGLAASLSPGDRLGAWEITGQLASGGMSHVYRARRADGTYEQKVAVKLFRTDLLGKQARLRFETERRILASLAHPNIARIIDGGATEGGVPYVVMELVEGETITDYAQREQLGVAERLELVQQLCDVLETAHERGVVHRDIKPGNVLIDGSGNVKVIDFGIAKVLPGDEDPRQAQLTRVDALMYTPEYASPEQVKGRVVGPASDVYSVGVVLYQLLTGSRPYEIDALTPAGIETVVCNTIPRSPSQNIQRAPSEDGGLPKRGPLRKQLRGDLDRIVMTALRKDPANRYRSAAALSEDIERHLTGQPVRARGASLAYRASKFVKRHPGATVATSVTVLTLAVALAVVSYQALEARRQAERAESATAFLVDMIGQSDPYVNAGTQTLASALQEAVPRIDERFSGQTLAEADVRYAVGYALAGQGELPLARMQLERALEVYESLDDELNQARSMNALAIVSWDESDYGAARQWFEKALERLPMDGSPQVLRARFGLLSDYGGLFPHLDQPGRAIEITDEALELLAAHPDIGIGTLDIAVLWNNRAVAFDQLEDYEQSIAAYETSIEKHRQANPEGSPDLATALSNLGMTYELVGDMNQAIAHLEQGLVMQRRLLGPEHPQYLLAEYNFGSMLLNAGEAAAAVTHLQSAVDGAATAYAPDHLYLGRFNQRLGQAYLETDSLVPAREYLLAADAVYRQRDDVPERWVEAVEQSLKALDDR